MRRVPLALVALVVMLAVGHVSAQPDFAGVSAIFEQRCVMCHSGANPPLGLNLDSYEAVMRGSMNGAVVVPGDPEGSELVRRVRGISQPRMPLTGPPFLSDEQIELIATWIAAGALQGTGESQAPDEDVTAAQQPPRPAPGEPVTFEHVAPILQQRCTVCHSDNGIMGGPPEGLRLGSYEAVIQGGERVVVVPGSPLASELYRRIVGHSLPRMPLNGPPYLSDEEIRLIRDWIEQGAASTDGREAPLPIGGEVRLHGVLTAQWELDGLAFRVTPQTRLDDNPGIGSYVEVRGVIGSDGQVRAIRVRPR